jgi:ABC-type lipoprotein export system ATPase subunit
MSDAASALPGVPPAPPAAPAVAGACLIQAVRLFKAYQIGKRRLEVLRGVSLSVARGEFVALCGASGSGKSTLLHLLGGLDAPDAGTVSFAGEDLATASMANLSRFRNRKVGFVFQAYHLLPELDALENVSLPSRLAREPALAAERRARDLLERVGLADRLEHKPYELSGGEQQRVAIARALMNSPELVLADEPTGNLDSHTGEGIMQLLRSLQAERQTTLLIATHDPRVAGTAPRVLELLDGQIAP